MKVRISYGVELEEVPSMVAGMVNQSVAELEQLVVDLKSAAGMLPVENSVMHNGAVQMLDHVRIRVGELDSTLNDAQSIMTGYINAMEEQENPPVLEPPAAPLPPPAAVPSNVDAVPVQMEEGDSDV